MNGRATRPIFLEPQVDPRRPQPLYQQLVDLIRSRITMQQWKLDEMIPSENELSAVYGVSVGTVKKALAVLTAEGILYRRQGKGTFVARPDFKRSFIRFFRFNSGEEPDGAIPCSQVLEYSVIPGVGRIQNALRLETGEKVLRIRRVRILRKVPLVLEWIYLPQRIFSGFEKIDISQALLYPIYDETFGQPVVWAEEFLEPGIADSETSERLEIQPGAPIIHVERIAYSLGDRPVEYRNSTGRGDRFRYHVEIR